MESRQKRLEQERIRALDASSVVCRDRVRGAFPSNIPSVGEMLKIESMMNDLFLTACFDNFHRNMGSALRFGDELRDHNNVYATPARAILTDAILAAVFRGMGWGEHARLCLDRAKSNVGVLFSDVTAESHAAASVLGLTLMGGEMVHYKYLLGLSAQIKNSNFQIDLSRAASYFFEGCMPNIVHPAAQEISLLAKEHFFSRVQLHAGNVRRALTAKLSLLEIATYGPWDYADHREGYAAAEDMTMEIAVGRLAQIAVAEQRILELMPQAVLTAPDLCLGERFKIPSAGLRCVLYNYLGDVKAARAWGYTTLSSFTTVSSVMWFFSVAEDLVHVIDVSISVQDRALFDQGMSILRQMAHFYPIAEKLVFALSDTSELFGGGATPRIEVMMDDVLTGGDLGPWMETA